jgi:hypothetical protein
MAIPAWVEARQALAGALRLARGDAGGLTRFDPTIDGFWRSFRAAVLCYPLYLILLSFPVHIGGESGPAVSELRLLTVETIHYVISWVAFPLIILPLADWLGRGQRFFAFMVAYNWCQVPQTVVFAAIALAGATGLLSADSILAADLITGLAMLVYEWFVAKVALATSGPRAVLIVIADLILATVLSHITLALY